MSASPYTFDAQDADVILRAPLQLGSEEFKDFHAHKVILSIASTLFHDMFSIPQPPRHTSENTTLEIVHVSESADALETFLRFIYPIDPPVVEDLRLLDDLLQLADKYMAKTVTTRLKKLLILPSFLEDDPIRVYAIARRANLNDEAELAITHSFKIDPVRDIHPAYLQIMTAEAYNSLLMSHATRRSGLISALGQARIPPLGVNACHCSNWFYYRLRQKITIAIWESPFLDKSRLDSCLNSTGADKSTCGLGSSCRVSTQAISKYLTDILNEVGKLG